eukprot:TRINITY_DN6014_c0_g2_i1.p1 TRINITY_DN6014_c0_g2~~TRINITY_DN6014_c0_g2_i1.p1  ORF type:complete len:455 (+),score=121.95 TRINITY_DN6014_c0_g2_i1:108-1472(+)
MSKSLGHSYGFFPILFGQVLLNAFGQYYLTEQVQIPPNSVAVCWVCYNVGCACVEFSIGMMIDRLNFKKKLLLFVVSVLCLALGIFNFWNISSESSMAFIYGNCLLLCFGVLALILWHSIFTVICPSEVTQKAALGSRQLFAIGSNFAVMVLVPILAGSSWETPARISYFALPLLASVLLLSFFIWPKDKKLENEESKEHLLEKKDETSTSKRPSLLTLFKSRALFFFTVAITIQYIGMGMVGSAFPLLSSKVFDLDSITICGVELQPGNQVSIMLSFFYIFGALCTKIWVSLAHRFGIGKVWVVETFLYAGTLTLLPASTNFFMGWGICCVMGMAVSGFLSFPEIFMSRIIAEDELKNGTKRAAAVASLRSLSMRLGHAIQGSLTAFILQTGGYVAGEKVLTSAGRNAILNAGVYIPAFVILLMSIPLYFFPLVGEAWKKVQIQTSEEMKKEQ